MSLLVKDAGGKLEGLLLPTRDATEGEGASECKYEGRSRLYLLVIWVGFTAAGGGG